MKSNFYLSTFSNTLPTDSLSHSLFHLNIISSFILYHHLFFLYLFSTIIFFNEKCYIYNIFCNIFSTKFMWKVVINSNLNSPLKLFFFSQILTNTNLLLKIYCDKISQLGFFILYIIFYSFISFSSTHVSSIPLLLFLFLLQNLPATFHLLLCS